MTSESRDGSTPNGGVRSVVYYMDDTWNPVEKEDATQAEISEMDADGKVIHRTYGTFNRSKDKRGD